MKKAPKITIVTPSYNQGRFIAETIESVLSQAGDFYIEYIIMDGGSTDNSVEVIRKYDRLLKEGKWPVKCLGITYSWTSGKDNGQTAAINKGFAGCTGEILNWINSDDRLTPGALASLVEAVAARPGAAAWVGSCNLVDEKGRVLETVEPRGLTKDKLVTWGVDGFFFQPSCFFSRKAWERCGPLDDNLYIAFDLDFFLKLADFEISGVPILWSEAAIHKDAKTTARKPLMRAEKCIVQARHGYEKLAIENIERAEKVMVRLEESRLFRWGICCLRVLNSFKSRFLKDDDVQ